MSHTEPEMKDLLLQGCIGFLAGEEPSVVFGLGPKAQPGRAPVPEPQAPACTRAPGSCRVLSELLLLRWSLAFFVCQT